MYNFNFLKSVFLLSISCFLFAFSPASAASVFYDYAPEAATLNQAFRVNVYFDTEGEAINAVSGNLVLPSNAVKLEEIGDGNSNISFWIEKPQLINGELTFSGIIPGAYSGNHGLLFSLLLTGQSSGEAYFHWNNFQALINDGRGTAAPIKLKDLNINISSVSSAAKDKNEIYDTVPPESFSVALSRDPLIFDNQWFIVFATQDKSSGISYYEVKEDNLLNNKIQEGKWQRALSPYRLKDQGLNSRINVRAVDLAGNMRTSILEAPNRKTINANYNREIIYKLIIVFFSALAFLVLLLCLKRRLKK